LRNSFAILLLLVSWLPIYWAMKIIEIIDLESWKEKRVKKNRFKNAFVSSMIVTLKEKNMQVIPFFTLSTHGDDSTNLLYLGQF